MVFIAVADSQRRLYVLLMVVVNIEQPARTYLSLNDWRINSLTATRVFQAASLIIRIRTEG